jgi:hypothetical protein
MQYVVRMRITAGYTQIVEAENEEEAKTLAWDTGDFGDAHDIDGEFISCEIFDEEQEGTGL